MNCWEIEKTMNDPINDEILRIKRELASQFGNDLDRIVADMKSRERNTITLRPREFPSQTGGSPKLQDDAVKASHGL
jgi:hypothetical protein